MRGKGRTVEFYEIMIMKKNPLDFKSNLLCTIGSPYTALFLHLHKHFQIFKVSLIPYKTLI